MRFVRDAALAGQRGSGSKPEKQRRAWEGRTTGWRQGRGAHGGGVARQVRRHRSRCVGRPAAGQGLALLGHVLAAVHADFRRDDIGHVQFPRLSRHVRISHLRPAAADPCQRRDLRRLLHHLLRPLLLPRAAVVRRPGACRAARLVAGLGLEHRRWRWASSPCRSATTRAWRPASSRSSLDIGDLRHRRHDDLAVHSSRSPGASSRSSTSASGTCSRRSCGRCST